MSNRVRVYKYVQVPGESHYARTYQKDATFHEWGCEYEEFESGAGNYSTAIVQYDDGTIGNIRVEQIEFILHGAEDSS